MKCVGFGPHEDKCENEAGTPWTPYWCPRCDEMRREHISRRLEQIRGDDGRAGRRHHDPTVREHTL